MTLRLTSHSTNYLLIAFTTVHLAGCGPLAGNAPPPVTASLASVIRENRTVLEERLSQIELANDFAKTHPRETALGLQTLFDECVPLSQSLAKRAQGSDVAEEATRYADRVRVLVDSIHRTVPKPAQLQAEAQLLRQAIVALDERVTTR